MKKGLALLCAILVTIELSGCGSGGIESETINVDVSRLSAETYDLTDTWQQIDNESDDLFHITVIDDDSILSESTDTDISAPIETVEEVSEQLDFEALPTRDGLVALFVTNNSDTVIDELDVQLNYLDENGNIIDVALDWHDMVLPGYTVVSRLEVPSSGFADAELEYNIQLGIHSGYVNHSEDIEISANPGDNCVIVQITNNSDVSIDEIEYNVVLYLGEDVVSICYPKDIYDVSSGKTITDKVDVYSSKTYSQYVYGKDYDRIEVYLNQAHTFNLSF